MTLFYCNAFTYFRYHCDITCEVVCLMSGSVFYNLIIEEVERFDCEGPLCREIKYFLFTCAGSQQVMLYVEWAIKNTKRLKSK